MTSAEATASQNAFILESHKDAIATLTLNRPEIRNSLSMGMLDALHQAFIRLSEQANIKVIILAANGPYFVQVMI